MLILTIFLTDSTIYLRCKTFSLPSPHAQSGQIGPKLSIFKVYGPLRTILRDGNHLNARNRCILLSPSGNQPFAQSLTTFYPQNYSKYRQFAHFQPYMPIFEQFQGVKWCELARLWRISTRPNAFQSYVLHSSEWWPLRVQKWVKKRKLGYFRQHYM